MRVIVCVVTYLAWDIFYTLVNVPYGTLNSAISADPNERTSAFHLPKHRRCAGGLVTLLLPFFVYENNTLIGERFVWIGLIMGAVAFVAYHFCLKMTTERFQVEQPAVTYHYFRTLKRILKKPPVACSVHCILCPARFLYLECADHKMGLSDLFSKHAAAHRRQPDRIHFLCGDDPLRWKNRPQVWQKAGGVGSAAQLVSFSAPCFCLSQCPAMGCFGPALYMVCLIVLQFGGALFQLVCWAMVADCTDYQQLQTGYREEGSVYAFYSLFRKLAQGVGASLIILSMTWVGYEAKLGANQLPGVGERMEKHGDPF
mgnify:CR=1 FL=1